MSDHNLVSSEEHEMAYLLRKFKLPQSKNNISALRKYLSDFKKNQNYSPHNRNFENYLIDKYIVFRNNAPKD